ncbi:PREDICTED: MATH domain and coiled-coil domain-containing protein At2g42460-like [Camelina sativa]|uniref:MATH domain and coiled-coil domain-containing protein At2g42460-like n=1 Tax=Camelina sativa TaxID=90675 RepID=A0ABM1R5S3_CAMSA|nr:PREDICTED: MATH domain and coiled-coil domain-containing protein At2g42460-like [Camelina sativa]
MGTELKMRFSWKIDNFSDRKERMVSKSFSCGDCEWCVVVDTKRYPGYDFDLSLHLSVHNPESLRLGWKRRARFFFVILNHSGKELRRTYYDGRSRLFCAEATPWAWGVKGLLSLTELQDPEKNILTVQVFVEVDEVVHQGQSTENDLLDFEGVQILASQAHSVTRILRQNPGFKEDFAPKYPELRAVYYTLLVSLIETLMSKSPQSLSLAELTNAQSQLTELTKAGFKLDLLESKLEELFLDRKKVAVQLEERVKNVELTLEKIKYAADARVSSFGFIDSLIKRFFLSCFSI